MELTNRNGIRGQTERVSKHTFVKPLTNKLCLVDVAAINGRISVLPGEILPLRRGRKSAEVVVLPDTSCQRKAEVSLKEEGLNVQLFQIRQGGSDLEFASLVLSGTE